MFQDRAFQFRDRLGWPVHVDETGEEHDQYDHDETLYVIWENPDGSHGGSMRLLPTLGRTMVNDHFLHLTGGQPVKDPAIWECTRFCLSRGASPRVAAALMLAGGEVMQRFDIEHFVGVFDAPMTRIYQKIGSSPVILGASGHGRHKTSVGLWQFSEQARSTVARSAAISAPLLRLWCDRSLGLPESQRMSA
jgi:acyl homoserine lactone synthase